MFMGSPEFTENRMFTGSIVALITPMDDKGAVDRASLKNLSIIM